MTREDLFLCDSRLETQICLWYKDEDFFFLQNKRKWAVVINICLQNFFIDVLCLQAI